MGSQTGGDRVAVLLSLIASCKANRVEPQAYLTDLFGTLPTLDTQDLDAMSAYLPDHWLAANPKHRWNIDDLRQQERKRSRQARKNRRPRKRR